MNGQKQPARHHPQLLRNHQSIVRDEEFLGPAKNLLTDSADEGNEFGIGASRGGSVDYVANNARAVYIEMDLAMWYVAP